MKINGKEYPMWSQFVERKNEWIGNMLDTYEMGQHAATTITDIILEPNGEESAYFSIVGEDFNCGFDVRFGGIGGGEPEYITFYGFGGHKFTIENAKREE